MAERNMWDWLYESEVLDNEKGMSQAHNKRKDKESDAQIKRDDRAQIMEHNREQQKLQAQYIDDHVAADGSNYDEVEKRAQKRFPTEPLP